MDNQGLMTIFKPKIVFETKIQMRSSGQAV